MCHGVNRFRAGGQSSVWRTARWYNILLSMTTSPTSSRIRFGVFEVDARSGELRRHGSRIDLQEQPFQALLLLVEQAGEVVSREELQKRLWPDGTFVDFDRGLNKAINKLRAALRDSADKPRYIETLPQRGYRFVAPVETVASESELEVNDHSEVSPRPETAHAPVSTQHESRALPTAKQEPVWIAPHRRLRADLKFGLMLVALVVVAIGVRVVWREAHRSNTPPRLATESRLTANSPDLPVTSAAISPDGKLMAYTDATGFYLRLVDSGETHPLSLPKGFDASVESWFPDSLHLVVSSIGKAERAPSLWEISALGGAPHRLVETGSSARVSPDGKHIGFLKGPWDDGEIWIANERGEEMRRVMDGGADSFGPIAWSPDGKRFAYVRSSIERSNGQMEIYSLEDGHTQHLFAAVGLGREVLWVATDRLIYSLPEPPPNQGDYNLWQIQMNGREDLVSPRRLSSDHDQVASISMARDGKRLALLRASSQSDVYLAELDVHGNLTHGPQRFTHDERQDFPSSWTPDSKAVLVVSDRDGPSHIFTQAIDAVQPELLVGGKQDVWLAHMTPDESGVLYLASAAQVGASDMVRLMRTSLAGGPSSVVLEKLGIVNFQCARLPSQLCVYGQVDSEFYRFFRFDPSNGMSAEISSARVKKEGGLNNWNLSPDGKYLVTCRSQNPYAQSGLRILDLILNKERTLPVGGVKLIIGTDWAADSKSIFIGGYMGRGSYGTRSGLVQVDLAGNVQTLVEGKAPAILGGTPSPDGRRLALGGNTYTANVWMVENF